MSVGYAILTSFLICAFAAALEGACAGRNVKEFFAHLKFPKYSAPLWAWSIIGAVYYFIFGFVTYRILRLESSTLRSITLLLVLSMMLVNALSNYVIFRAQNLYVSFLIGTVFPLLDLSLLLCLIQLDSFAAAALLPYLIYRVYAVWWGYAVWRLNR